VRVPNVAQLVALTKPRWRRRVVVAGVGIDLTDYTVAVPLDIRDRVSIKFPSVFAVDEEGNVLPAVVDKCLWTLGTPVVWVKIPSLPANTTKEMYLYYGAVRPLRVFRYSDVFIYGDDFQDPGFSDAYWSVGVFGSPSVTRSYFGSALRIYGTFLGNSGYYLYKPSISYAPGKHTQIIWRTSYASTYYADTPRLNAATDTAGRTVYVMLHKNAWHAHTWSSTEGGVSRASATGYYREYVVVDVYITPSGVGFVIRSLERAYTVLDYTFSTTPVNAVLEFGVYNYSTTSYTLDTVIYQVFMRNYVSPEPGVEVGPEEEVYRYPDTM